ncbi:hypothetical protein ACSDQ9_13985 [Aestuariimicrobium soli]|uniref:hypothetical protein n=1 Tax=Aestuariimicrobium soli TaxID=2035834 RepID=UPI003EBBCC17
MPASVMPTSPPMAAVTSTRVPGTIGPTREVWAKSSTAMGTVAAPTSSTVGSIVELPVSSITTKVTT